MKKLLFVLVLAYFSLQGEKVINSPVLADQATTVDNATNPQTSIGTTGFTVAKQDTVGHTFIVIKDASVSFDDFKISQDQFQNWLNQQATNRPVVLIGFNILSNSKSQIGYMSHEIKPPKLVEAKGNFLTRARAETSNEEANEKWKKELQKVGAICYVKIFSKHSEKWSDVNNALRMAKMVVGKERKEGRKVTIILLSDLIQDTKYKKLHPVTFEKEVTIFVIGHAPKVNLKTTFPENEVIEIGIFEQLNRQ